MVALVALRISAKNDAPPQLSFGWQRAPLLGAFFNGALLLALGLSVFLQSVERFISLQRTFFPVFVLVAWRVGVCADRCSGGESEVDVCHGRGGIGVEFG